MWKLVVTLETEQNSVSVKSVNLLSKKPVGQNSVLTTTQAACRSTCRLATTNRNEVRIAADTRCSHFDLQKNLVAGTLFVGFYLGLRTLHLRNELRYGNVI